jgi:RHS repeat-associated protein
VNSIFISQEVLSVLNATQVNGELVLLESDLGVDNLTAITYTPPSGQDDCINQYDPVTQPEAYKQCLCEYEPANCPDDVVYFFHSDQLGSSSVVTDADGNPYQFLVYLPWGEVLGEQKAAQFSTPYQFNGKELDSETGLYNYGARYYDPSLSLWLGVDPLADQMPGWSPYNYVFNNPINLTDPTGMSPIDPDPTDPDPVIDGGAYVEPTITATRGPTISQDNTGNDSPNIANGARQILGTAMVGVNLLSDMQSEQLYANGVRKGLDGNYQLKGRNANQFKSRPMTAATKPVSQVAPYIRRYASSISKISFGLGALSAAHIGYQYRVGQISGQRASYGLAGLASSIGVGMYYGTGYGLLVGATVGTGERIYDQAQINKNNPPLPTISNLSSKYRRLVYNLENWVRTAGIR